MRLAKVRLLKRLLKKRKTINPIDPSKVSDAEIQRALADLLVAWAVFNEAEDEFVDVAVLELIAAEKRYNTLLKLAKEARLHGQRQAG